ncbi:2-oxoacid_dh-domain-containing protein [Fragilariopsis cylindrus CCMP1102]|uniref:Dihydrolipoamide acetyltransferase component of pyruvate dehydrogenase complex n=1 Tax=Fragilariopsis cylindrus CCMP1102 TaxID=635003 RepID=A0A1E7FXB2_9STRA|nr:2-oxoacid_dh-domain-containing protein [Fragilariopsis cylindrus CCMP1102]|eukprot:OEU22777.1 2-oxoacid_dh-domain-containing protein [Fragilariopsis cylindrus CCMP1102]
MPALSSTMKEGKVVSWLKSEGDEIEAGEAIMVVESDKADMDVEAFEDGFLAKILVNEGEMAPVGDCVALIAASAEEIDAVVAAAGDGSAAVAAPAPPAAAEAATSGGAYAASLSGGAPPAAAAAPAAATTAAPKASSTPAAVARAPGARVVASPLAKKNAEALGIDISTVAGTGPDGRITASDVQNAASGAAPAPAAKSAAATSSGEAAVELPDGFVPFTGMQKAVAGNMVATLTIPSFQVSTDIEMTSFEAMYKKLKPDGVSVSAMLAKACALAIEKHPIINSGYSEQDGGGILFKQDINIAMAVAIEGGLMTPTLMYANERPVKEIAENWKELVGKAKTGTLSPAEYTTGTFTISNMGMFGVTQFGSLLPVGHGGILAVGATQDVIVPDTQAVLGMKKARKMTITLTADHRHIYGSDAALFLRTLKSIMENDVDKIAK